MVALILSSTSLSFFSMASNSGLTRRAVFLGNSMSLVSRVMLVRSHVYLEGRYYFFFSSTGA